MSQLRSQLVHSNERVDCFIRENIQLIHSNDFFTTSLDAILLADYIRLPKRRSFRFLDFCSGSGAIPLLLARRTTVPLAGVELQAPLVDMAQRSARLNQLEEQVRFIHADVKALTLENDQLYDIISCNPPFFAVDQSHKVHRLDAHALARHEIALTLADWVKKASQLLKNKGRLFFVHRPERLDAIMQTLLEYGFSVHRLKFVYPKAGALANTLLVEAIYQGGRQGVRVEPPLIVHEADNSYTQAMKEIYYGERADEY